LHHFSHIDLPFAGYGRLPAMSVFAVVLCIAGAALASGPSSTDPLRPLSLWSDREDVQTLHSEAAELCNQAYKSAQSIAERVEAGKIKQIKLAEVGKTAVANMQLKRLAQQLTMWGEPAGLDFQVRAGQIDGQLQKAMDAMRPVYRETLEKGRTTLAAKYKKHKKNLDGINKLIEQKKFSAAEAKLLPIYNEVQLIGVWFSTFEQREGTLTPFDQAVSNLDRLYTPVRQEKALELIAEDRAKRQPDFDGLLKAIAAATTSVAASGQAELDGQKLSGPKLFSLLAARTQQTQADMLYCRALDWATYTGPGKAALERLTAEHEKFCTALPAALAGLIEADAARAVDPEATQLLAEYCQVAASVVLAGDWEPLTTAISAALSKLESKSPAARSYREATDDLLRWRARIAEAEARAARKDYGDVPKEAVASAIYRDPLPDVARATGEALDGKKVKWTNLLAPERGQPAVGRYQNTAFASSTPVDLSSLDKRMNADLMIGDKTPPLTLEAAMARESFQRGDLAEVGGSVGLVELEGLIPLFARPTPETAGLMRLGPPQSEVDLAREPQRHVRYRVEIVPDWARSKYGFVKIKGP
jgi:hypothetical protein